LAFKDRNLSIKNQTFKIFNSYVLQRTRKEKKTYSEDWAYGDEEEIEGVRSFSLQEKLDSTRYLNHNFSKQMDGKGMIFTV